MVPNWLPIRCDLHDDPAVIAIACAVGCDEFAVVGRLVRLWAWANEQLVDGNAASVTGLWIDRYLSMSGFADAMTKAGWLEAVEGGVRFPKFDVWNSQGAKVRLVTSRRVQKHRAKRNAESNAPSVTGETKVPLPRGRGRVTDIEPPYPPAGGVRPAKKAATEHRHFAGFWAAYPRKTAKPKAAEAFSRIDPDDDMFAAMLAALDLQRRSPGWVKDGGQFIPHPATWLNGRRWEDRPPEVGKAADPTISSSGLPYDDYANYIPQPNG